MAGFWSRLFGRRQTSTPRDPTITRAYWGRGAGLFVNPDIALTLSTVWACVRYISATIGYLPWQVRLIEHEQMTRTADGRRKLGKTHIQTLPTHPVTRILHRKPNGEVSAMTWRETLMHHALLWGNGYSEIQRDGYGKPIAVWNLEPDRVTVKRDDATGEIYYRVTNGYSNFIPAFTDVPARDIFHLHGLGFDGLVGYSPVAYAARSIGLGIAAENFGAGFYGNNAVPGGVLKHPKRLSDTAAKRLKDRWNEMLQGSEKGNKTIVLEEDMEWIATMVPPEQAQFLGTRQFNVKEVCRWYGLPPTKIADLEQATYNNVENLNREVVNDALMPWITRLEQEADLKLLTSNYGGLESHVNVSGLLRGDSESRAKYLKEIFMMGGMSINEVREQEGLNPVEGGDRYFVPTNNVTPLDRIDEVIDSQMAPSPLEDAATSALSGGGEEDSGSE